MQDARRVDQTLSLEAFRVRALATKFAKEIACFNPMLSTKLLTPLKRLSCIEVADIGPDAGFELDPQNCKMTLSSKALQGMIAVAREKDSTLPFYARLGRDHIQEIATALYTFHEVTHISQGVADFQNVQRLKRTFGKEDLASLDTVADVLAASAYAALQSALVGGDIEKYAENFHNALIFQVDICFPAFGFGPDKPHKVNRGLGILLSIVATQTVLSDPKKLVVPFDVPFVAKVSGDYQELAVKTVGLGHEEYNFIHGFDSKILREICHNLECGDTMYLISLMREIRVA